MSLHSTCIIQLRQTPGNIYRYGLMTQGSLYFTKKLQRRRIVFKLAFPTGPDFMGDKITCDWMSWLLLIIYSVSVHQNGFNNYQGVLANRVHHQIIEYSLINAPYKDITRPTPHTAAKVPKYVPCFCRKCQLPLHFSANRLSTVCAFNSLKGNAPIHLRTTCWMLSQRLHDNHNVCMFAIFGHFTVLFNVICIEREIVHTFT